MKRKSDFPKLATIELNSWYRFRALVIRMTRKEITFRADQAYNGYGPEMTLLLNSQIKVKL